MSAIDNLKQLLSDIKYGGASGYTRYENTVLTLLKSIFDDGNEFVTRAGIIKNGWGAQNSVLHVYGNANKLQIDRETFDAYVMLLEEAIDFLSKYSVDTKGGSSMDMKKIFIVHGHDDRLKFEISDWLRSINLEPIILHLQANMGIFSIIEKIEQNADVGCAIVLFTADDEGKAKSETDLKQRARQNVVFEAGYFIGRLGRKKVVMLYDDGIEAPGDLSGCIYISSKNSGEWKEDIRKEFNEMGIDYKR